MKIEQSIGYTFLQTANTYRVKLEKKMNEIGLHYGQISVLSLLWKKDGQSQIRLAKKLNLSQPTINKMVKSLAQNEFVSCNQCQKDGRKMRVYLTQKGRDAETFVSAEIEILQTTFFAPFTETEQLIFKQLCDKLTENIVRSKVDK